MLLTISVHPMLGLGMRTLETVLQHLLTREINIIFKNYTDLSNYKKNIEYKTTIYSNFDLDNLNINDRTNKLNNIKFKQFANNLRNNLKLYLLYKIVLIFYTNFNKYK